MMYQEKIARDKIHDQDCGATRQLMITIPAATRFTTRFDTIQGPHAMINDYASLKSFKQIKGMCMLAPRTTQVVDAQDTTCRSGRRFPCGVSQSWWVKCRP